MRSTCDIQPGTTTKVDRAVADDLVGDVPLRALRVARFWLLYHGLYLPRSGQKTFDRVVLLP